MTHFRHTAGAAQEDFTIKPVNPDALKEQMDAALAHYQKEGELFLKHNEYLFTEFAKSSVVTFKMSDGFFIDLEKKVVHLDTSWFYDRKCTKEQILWAVLHELTHFRDLVEDEKGLMDTFDYMEKQSEKSGQMIINQYKKHFPNNPEYIDLLKKKNKKGMTQAAVMMYDEHHTFFNVFDDIYVNTEIPRRAASYEKAGTWGKQPRDLYAEKLFATQDYRGTSRHRQFIYALLRDVMVPDEEVIVSQEVQLILDTPISFVGKTYTPRELVKKCIIPVSQKDTKAGTRSLVLKQTLERIYLELLKKDMEEWIPKPPVEQGKGGGEGEGEGEGEGPVGDPSDEQDPPKGGKPKPGKGKGKDEPTDTPPEGGEGKPEKKDKGEEKPKEGKDKGGFEKPFHDEQKDFEKNSPDQISPEDFEKLKQQIKKDWEEKAAKEKADARSDEEKEAEAAAERAKQFQKNYDVSEQEYTKYLEIFQEVAPYVEDLAELWEYLISQSGGDVLRTERLRPEGTTLSIPAVIEAFPQILAKEFDGLRIMKKETKEYLPANKPEDIRLRVIGDVSGSMDSKKLAMLKRCIVLLLTSFAQFQYKLDMTRTTTKSDLHVDTEAWIYSSQARKVKGFNPDHSYQKAQADIMHLLAQIESSGSTATDRVYQQIVGGYTEAEKSKIKEGKRMDICIEMTDGSPDIDSVALTQQLTNELRAMGVIVKAFQVGEVWPSERASFELLWNEKKEDPHGVCIGSDLAKTLPALVQLLQQYLANVRL